MAPDAERPGIAGLPLGIALALLVVLTVMPGLATDALGRADHVAALLLFGAMSAGFVRGVGFIPRHRVPRLLFSTAACLGLLLLGGLRLAANGRLPFLS